MHLPESHRGDLLGVDGGLLAGSVCRPVLCCLESPIPGPTSIRRMQSRQIGASVLQLSPQREYELVVTDGGAEVDSHRQTTLIEAPRDGESGTPGDVEDASERRDREELCEVHRCGAVRAHRPDERRRLSCRGGQDDVDAREMIGEGVAESVQFRQDTQEFDGCHAPPRPHDLCSHRFEHVRIEVFSIAQEPGQMCPGDRAEDGADPPDLFGGPRTHDTMPYCRQHLSGIRRGLHVMNRLGFRSYLLPCPASAGWADSRPA